MFDPKAGGMLDLSTGGNMVSVTGKGEDDWSDALYEVVEDVSVYCEIK